MVRKWRRCRSGPAEQGLEENLSRKGAAVMAGTNGSLRMPSAGSWIGNGSNPGRGEQAEAQAGSRGNASLCMSARSAGETGADALYFNACAQSSGPPRQDASRWTSNSPALSFAANGLEKWV